MAANTQDAKEEFSAADAKEDDSLDALAQEEELKPLESSHLGSRDCS